MVVLIVERTGDTTSVRGLLMLFRVGTNCKVSVCTHSNEHQSHNLLREIHINPLSEYIDNKNYAYTQMKDTELLSKLINYGFTIVSQAGSGNTWSWTLFCDKIRVRTENLPTNLVNLPCSQREQTDPRHSMITPQ